MNSTAVGDGEQAGPLRLPHIRTFAIAALLVGVVVYAGSRDLNAPWIQGDEHIFIAGNADVTDAPSGWRHFAHALAIFSKRHEDLYQPFTIWTYALEWNLWPEHRVSVVRGTDVFLQAVNGLLAWSVVAALLRRFGDAPAPWAHDLGAAAALMWAAHPMLVPVYAADMGRTHILSVTFAMLGVLAQLQALSGSRPVAWSVATVALLTLAMLNKVIPAWFAVVFVIDAAALGLRGALCSPRAWSALLVCLILSSVNYWATRESLLLEGATAALFGDPFSRAALAAFISLRNFLLPGADLSTLYLPDIRTGWDYPPVLLGAAALLLLLTAAVRSCRRPRNHLIAVGLIWFLATWLPVSGLIGARVASAQDRYFYLSALGLLVAVASLAVRVLRSRVGAKNFAGWSRTVLLLVAGGAAIGGSVSLNARYVSDCRSTLARAERVLRLYPDDPRAVENLAAAYEFGLRSPTLESERGVAIDWQARWREETDRAASLAESKPEVFRTAGSRAAFHRRLSFAYWKMPAPEQSLAQALRAADFDPGHRLTWLRLAYAYQSLGHIDKALECYRSLEELLRGEPDAPGRAVAYISYAELLVGHRTDFASALPLFRAALCDPEITPANRLRATLGLARCEVMAGEGAVGERLAREVAERDAGNLEAIRVLALYHLRSHHWAQAEAAYARVLRTLPADYESLRGYQEVCAQTGRWLDAVFMWQQALRVAPRDRAFRSFLVWSMACAGVDNSGPETQRLLLDDPDNPLACFASMLNAIRAGDFQAAIDWIDRAGRGTPVPEAREAARADAALRLLLGQGRLPPEAGVARAALLLRTGRVGEGVRLLEEFRSVHPESPAAALAERLLQAADQSATGVQGEPSPS